MLNVVDITHWRLILPACCLLKERWCLQNANMLLADTETDKATLHAHSCYKTRDNVRNEICLTNYSRF